MRRSYSSGRASVPPMCPAPGTAQSSLGAGEVRCPEHAHPAVGVGRPRGLVYAVVRRYVTLRSSCQSPGVRASCQRPSKASCPSVAE